MSNLKIFVNNIDKKMSINYISEIDRIRKELINIKKLLS